MMGRISQSLLSDPLPNHLTFYIFFGDKVEPYQK